MRREQPADRIRVFSEELFQSAAPETIAAFSTIVNRALLANKLGAQYGTDRDIYQALGYTKDPTFEHYAARYARQDIAKAVIDRPANATWQGGVKIKEPDQKTTTPLEQAWDDLVEDMGLIAKLKRLDKLSGIGTYGVLLLGLSDVSNQDDLKKPVVGKNLKLLYVKPLTQASAVIKKWETNTTNKRYGLPIIYGITIQAAEDSSSREMMVHHSRIIHIAYDLGESEIEGTPRLEAILDRLFDLEKITGGSAEMFWRGARPGLFGKMDKDVTLSATENAQLETQVDEFEHNLRRLLIGRGLDLQSLSMQVADPGPHVDVQLQMISAQTGIPKRILTGTERGELASTQDSEAWLSMIEARRNDFAEPIIVRPFVDRLIEFGILPAPRTKNKYAAEWKDLWSLSDKEQAEVGQVRSNAVKNYAANLESQLVLPLSAFYKYCLGLNEDEIDEIMIEVEKAMAEEKKLQEEMAEEEENNPPPTDVEEVEEEEEEETPVKKTAKKTKVAA